MKFTVGTTPQKLTLSDNSRVVLQNASPTAIIQWSAKQEAFGQACFLEPGTAYDYPGTLAMEGGELWVVANEAAADLRVNLF